MASIYLIRHGQASFGAQNYDELSALGQRQATLTGGFFAASGTRFVAAYCGTLQRQRHTAELVLATQPGDLPIRVDERLDEVRNDEHLEHLLPILAEEREDVRALVDAGFSSSKQYQKVIDAVFNYWVSPECRVDGIQSWDEYSGGVRAALGDIVSEQGAGRTTAVFTSGGTIATLVAAVLGLPGSATYQFYEPIFNCSVTQLLYSRERVSLSYFNDCSFLRHMGAQSGESLVSYR